jgi:hypothetical protein
LLLYLASCFRTYVPYFPHAREPQEALEIAFSLMGRNAKVAILQRGGEILPIIK